MGKKENIKVNVLDVLLDESNTSPIIMYAEDGKEVEFEQIAVIPLFEDKLYCILKPITEIEGIKNDEAVAFEVIADKEDSYLKVVDNEAIAIQVFNAYYSLIENEMIKVDKEIILNAIRSDVNMQNVYDEDTKEKIEYEKMDIHPFRYQNQLFAIIKETEYEDFNEALVWQVVETSNGKRLEWVENEQIEFKIIQEYLKGESHV